MIEELLIEGQSVLYAPESKVLLSAVGAVSLSGNDVKVSKPSAPVFTQSGGGTFLKWYSDDNQYPQLLIDAIAGNEILSRGLSTLANAIYSGGLRYGKITGEDSDGNLTYERASNPEIDSFLRNTNFKAYLREAACDLVTFYNIFPEIVLSADKTSIVGLSSHNSAHCRYSLPNSATGISDFVFINTDWLLNTDINNAEKVKKVKVLDSYYRSADALKLMNVDRVILPLNMPSPGKIHYQEAPWCSVLRTKWPELASLIPSFKVSAMKNQMSVKYHIEYPVDYWKKVTPDWDTLNSEQKLAIKKNWLDEFNKVVKGIDNASSTIMTDYLVDGMGNKISGWNIKVLEGKSDDGKYLEDSQEASSHLLFAMGLDASIIGSAPGGKLGAGSGSDKRVAYNMLLEQLKPLQDLILEPLYLIRDFNGWPADLEFWIHANRIQGTSNQSPSTRL
jgi:hypothetical protein